MVKVDLDNSAIDILNRIVLREKYETPSDAIRHLDNEHVLQAAVIHKQDNQITQLENRIERLKELIDKKEDKEIIDAAIAFMDQLNTFNDFNHPEVQTRAIELQKAVANSVKSNKNDEAKAEETED